MEWMLKDYARLIKMEEMVNALIDYVRGEKYSVERKAIEEMIEEILGFSENGGNDGADRKQDGR